MTDQWEGEVDDQGEGTEGKVVLPKDYSKQIAALKFYNDWKKTQERGISKDLLREKWNAFKVENGMPITKARVKKVKSDVVDDYNNLSASVSS